MRYFIIFYYGEKENKSYNGNISISLTLYPSHEKICELINNANNIDTKTVITNVIELNETDFENWNK